MNLIVEDHNIKSMVDVKHMVTVFEKPAKEDAKHKAPVYDLTDEQYESMSAQEKTKRFHSSFKFKTEMLTSKVLLIDGHFVQSEVFQIRD